MFTQVLGVVSHWCPLPDDNDAAFYYISTHSTFDAVSCSFIILISLNLMSLFSYADANITTKCQISIMTK